MACILLMALYPPKKDEAKPYHSPQELALLQGHFMPPIDSDEYFLDPVNCKGCHGFDTLGIALVDGSGQDVNIFDDWETSMMALSARDPLWRAKVSHEILVNPAHANELQTFCTSCHAPMGHFTAMYKGLSHYTLGDLAADTLGLAGVACMACHSMDSLTQGVLFSGNLHYDTSNIAYGPFENPMMGPMQLYVGLTPVFSPHLNRSSFCSPCHTLISAAADLSGNPTGTTFTEQATYHEWLNSSFPAQEITCQSCHMPQIEDNVKIATGYTALPGRSPFNLHQFSGANSFMVKLMKDNKASLAIAAPDANFDSTLSVNTRLLKLQTLDVNAYIDTVMDDTAFVNIRLTNKAGHKFPSGYPSRRSVLQVVAVKQSGDTLWASGLFDQNQEVKYIDTLFETHHDIISDSSDIQVYEMVMGDLNGDKTTVLERAYSPLKDNRIPPAGFSTLHNAYDTCRITGNAAADPDFNLQGITQGTGQDIVHYHIPMHNYHGLLTVFATVFYQSVPPAWLNEMSGYSSPEIDSFLVMYTNADRSPLAIAGDTLSGILISTDIPDTREPAPILLFPNPNHTGRIQGIISQKDVTGITLYNSQGKVISSRYEWKKATIFEMELPVNPGIYYLRINTRTGIHLKKVIRL